MIAADARCAKHPDTPANGTCARCGSFICPADTTVIDLVAYCATCAVRPDVDWVEGYRQSKLGKRSSTEWTLLVLVPLQLVYPLMWSFIFVQIHTNSANLGEFAALLAASAVNGILWVAGRRIARKLHLALAAAWLLVLGVAAGPTMGVLMVLPATIIALLASAPLSSVPSKLFFRLPVERSALLKSYHSIENNPFARYAVTFGVVGLLLPVFPIAAIVCGALAWRRVDLTAKPPVGKRGLAIFGLGLGLVGLVSSWVFWWQAFRYRPF